MKVIFITTILFLNILFLQSQIVFKKYQVSNTPYAAYFPNDPVDFEKSKSEDSLLIYTGSVFVEDTEYGLIMVDLTEDYMSQTKDEIQGLMEAYLDYLKTLFEVNYAKAYEKDLVLNNNKNAIGISDEWIDGEGNTVLIKSWSDKDVIAVLFIIGDEMPDKENQDIFLNGFVFVNQ